MTCPRSLTLIVLLALALLAAPLAVVLFVVPTDAAAQTAKIPRVGVLSDEASPAKSPGPFRRGLRELGYVEGQNISIEYRYAEGRQNRLAVLAAELVGLNMDVILAVGTPAAQAAKNATKTIPIVFTRIGDPVGVGLVPVLARPGGNLTGVSILTVATGAKRLELLKETLPRITRVGVLWDPSFPPATLELKEIEGAARSLKVRLQLVTVRDPSEFDKAFAAITNEGADALFVSISQMFADQRTKVTALAAKSRLPAIFSRSEFVEAGGLMSYGPDFTVVYHRAAAYVDKILKGTKPGDLPVEQPTKLQLLINLKTAKALGLTIPQSLLIRADEIIE